MPVVQKLLSLDEMFHASKRKPIIINDLGSRTEEDREHFNNLVHQNFETDVVSMMPTCDCGLLRGAFRTSKEDEIGRVCPNCQTPVRQVLEDDVHPILWFRRPGNDEYRVEKLINPIVLIMLDQRFTKSKFRIIQWLIDRNYAPNIKRPKIVEQMIADGVPRGYNSFVQNFNQIMTYLFTDPEFKVKSSMLGFLQDMIEIRKDYNDPLRQLLEENQDCIFSDHIPLMNRSLLVLEEAPTGIYLDLTILDIKDVLNTMLSIDQDFFNKNPLTIENRTGKILIMLADYYKTMLKTNLNPKEGELRKHVYGCRTNFSFRTVITGHEEIHDYDEIWAPWSVGLTTFQLHIMNRLMDVKLGEHAMTQNEAMAFIYEHIYKYNPRIDQILKELVEDALPGKGIYCMLQRNPSLMQGSAVPVRLTRFKTDPEDLSTSMSDLVATSMNA